MEDLCNVMVMQHLLTVGGYKISAWSPLFAGRAKTAEIWKKLRIPE